jgi:hypothetical protein
MSTPATRFAHLTDELLGDDLVLAGVPADDMRVVVDEHLERVPAVLGELLE